MTEIDEIRELETMKRIAIENSATHLCKLINTTFGDFLLIPLTPVMLIDRLCTCDDLFDGKTDKSLGTLRGLQQRLRNLQLALQGRPGKLWLEYWSKTNGNRLPENLTKWER